VAMIDDRWMDRFRHNPNLRYCDHDYWQQVFDRTRISTKAQYQGL
jgi:hypothetical protein